VCIRDKVDALGLNRTLSPPLHMKEKGEKGRSGPWPSCRSPRSINLALQGDADALSGCRGRQAGFQGRAGYAPVRVGGVGVRRAVRRTGSTRHRAPGARDCRRPIGDSRPVRPQVAISTVEIIRGRQGPGESFMRKRKLRGYKETGPMGRFPCRLFRTPNQYLSGSGSLPGRYAIQAARTRGRTR
jgi:hypothetical protein